MKISAAVQISYCFFKAVKPGLYKGELKRKISKSGKKLCLDLFQQIKCIHQLLLHSNICIVNNHGVVCFS